ncbi:hypothetical protein [Paenibacillus sp. 481]|uniref:hypothetical protein n=1 Tax=Paenibacillus sp. 481 TaxID=2835869 RepID=UPI001E48A56A|nr:hypothetical protein [Paenibacillus sp. 481]UHA72298.1 hypothetical protein KIK04_16630 [Paenibacillus sp. 481]
MTADAIRGFSHSFARAQQSMVNTFDEARKRAMKAWERGSKSVENTLGKSTARLNRVWQNTTIRFERLRTMGQEVATTISNVARRVREALSNMSRDIRNRAEQILERRNGGGSGGGAGGSGGAGNGVVGKMLSGVQEPIQTAITSAAHMEDLRARYVARFGNKEMGEAYFERFRESEFQAGNDPSQTLKSILSLSTVSTREKDLDTMNNMVQRLATFSGASQDDVVVKFKDTMMGKSDELFRSFNMSLTRDQEKNLAKFAKAGDFDSYLKLMDDLMTQAGMGQQAYSTLLDGPVEKWKSLISGFKEMWARTGQAGMEALLPIITTLTDGLKAGDFVPIFDAISIGLAIIGTVIGYVAQRFIELVSFISSGIGFILPLIIGLATAFLIYNGVIMLTAMYMRLMAMWQAILNMIMNANPIMLVISLLLGLVAALLALGTVMQPVREMMAQVFRFMGKVISWFVGGAIEYFEILGNSYILMINGMLAGINFLVNTIAELLGMEGKLELKLDYLNSDDLQKKVKTSIEGGFDWAADGVEKFDATKLKDKFGGTTKAPPTPDLSKFNTGRKGVDKLSPMVIDNMPDLTKLDFGGKGGNGGMGGMGGRGGVGGMGNMGMPNAQPKKEVDISDEKLVMMRELAEMQAVSNFVSLTPTVTVSTGDIHQGADIDTLVSRIEQKLEEEFKIAAEGVYA